MTQKQMITESELLARVSGLREKMAIMENQTEAAQEIGNIVGGAAGLAATPFRAAADVGNWVSNKAGQAWDATKQAAGAAVDSAKQGVQNFATGVQQGWAATDPGKTLGYNPDGGSSAKVKWPKTPEEIKAFQQANGLTADGILGPKTAAALKAKGAQPPAGQGAKTKPASAPNIAKPAPATGSGGPAPIPGNTDPTKGAVDYSLTGGAPSSAPGIKLPAASNATANTTGGPTNLGTAGTQAHGQMQDMANQVMQNMNKQASAAGYAPAAMAGQADRDWEESIQNESVQYKNDELSRLVSLVQYR